MVQCIAINKDLGSSIGVVQCIAINKTGIPPWPSGSMFAINMVSMANMYNVLQSINAGIPPWPSGAMYCNQ